MSGQNATFYQVTQSSNQATDAAEGRLAALTFGSRPAGATATTVMGRMDVAHDGAAADGKTHVTMSVNAGPTANATFQAMRITAETVATPFPANLPSVVIDGIPVQASSSQTLMFGFEQPATDTLNSTFAGPLIKDTTYQPSTGTDALTTETVIATGTVHLDPTRQVSILAAAPETVYRLPSILPAAAAGFEKTVTLQTTNATKPLTATVCVRNAANTSNLFTVALSAEMPSVAFLWTGSAWVLSASASLNGWSPVPTSGSVALATPVAGTFSWPAQVHGNPWTTFNADPVARWISASAYGQTAVGANVPMTLFRWHYHSLAEAGVTVTWLADASGVLYLNGQQLGTTSGAATTAVSTGTLRSGWNLVRVDVTNDAADSAAGLVLVMRRTDTTAIVLRTDSTWQATIPHLLVDNATERGALVAIKSTVSTASDPAKVLTHADAVNYYLDAKLFRDLAVQAGDIVVREDGQNSDVLANMKTVAALEAVRTNILNGAAWFYNTHGNSDLSAWMAKVYTGTEAVSGGAAATYPSAALSSNTSLAGYEATASTNSGTAWRAFDFQNMPYAGTGSAGTYWQSDPAAQAYSATTGAYLGTTTTYLADGTARLGEWLQLKVAGAMQLSSLFLRGRTDATGDTLAQTSSPRTFTVLGSLSGRSGTWTVLATFTDVMNWTSAGQTLNLPALPPLCAVYFRVVVQEVSNFKSNPPNASGNNVALSEVRLYGYEAVRRLPDAQQNGSNLYSASNPYQVFNSAGGTGSNAGLSDHLNFRHDGSLGETAATKKTNSVWFRILPYAARGLLLALDPSHPQCYPGTGPVFHDLSKGALTCTFTGAGAQLVPASDSGLVAAPAFARFAGTGGNTSYGALSGPVAGTPNTLAAWIRISATAPSTPVGPIISNYPDANNVVFQIDTNGHPVLVWSGQWSFPSSTCDVRTGMWEHLCWCRDTVANMVYLYRNGRLVESKAGAGTDLTMLSSFYIGNDKRAEGWPLPGDIGGILIYNRALTAAEVLGNFMADRPKYYSSMSRPVQALQPDAATGLGQGLVFWLDPLRTGCVPQGLATGTLNNLAGTGTATLSGATGYMQYNGTIRLPNPLGTENNCLQLSATTNVRTISFWFCIGVHSPVNYYLLDARIGDGSGYIWLPGVDPAGPWGAGSTMSINGGAAQAFVPSTVFWLTGWNFVSLTSNRSMSDDITLFGRFTLDACFDVTVGPVMLFNRVLTDAENAALYNMYKDRFVR